MHTQDNPSSNSTPVGRGDERVRLRRPALLALGSDGNQPPLHVQLEDISFSGAGIVSATEIPAGTPAALLLQSAEHSPCTIRGHVLACKPTNDAQFRISMQFDVVNGPTLERIRYAFFPNDAII